MVFVYIISCLWFALRQFYILFTSLEAEFILIYEIDH